MEEYKIVEKDKTNFQKLLNQWKYSFHIIILWMDLKEIKGDFLYCALIKRTPKE